MTVAFVVDRRPPSAQKKHDARFEQTVGTAAKSALGQTQALLSEPVYVRITWFRNEFAGPDLDNIAKPIIDGMKQVVFDDDKRLVQCILNRVETQHDYTISARCISVDAYGQLLEMLRNGTPHILYVEAGPFNNGQQVIFGPVDGGMP
jgi:Holliday junction resolvase RusA-like endonuclease